MEDLPAVEDALTLCETSPIHLDMNYACFQPCYADEETLSKVKTLALDFYRSLAEEAKQELLAGYTDDLFRQRFNDYLAANGRSGAENSGLEDIAFYRGRWGIWRVPDRIKSLMCCSCAATGMNTQWTVRIWSIPTRSEYTMP